MTTSMLFLPVAILGAALLVLGSSSLLWAPLLAAGIGGTLVLAALGARHDDELRRDVTGTGATQLGPDDPGRRSA